MRREHSLSVVKHEPNIESDNELFRQNKLVLIARAQSERDQGKRERTQYRNFYVGCAMLGEDGQIFSGHNLKTKKTDPTLCAERAALEEAVDHINENDVKKKNIRIIGIVIVSEESSTDRDETSSDNTLRPCSRCVAMLNSEPHFTDDTVLLTVNDKETGGRGRLEEQITIRELEKKFDQSP